MAIRFSDVALPVLSMPACHKLIRERCLPRQRGAARIDCESKVLEVWGVALYARVAPFP